MPHGRCRGARRSVLLRTGRPEHSPGGRCSSSGTGSAAECGDDQADACRCRVPDGDQIKPSRCGFGDRGPLPAFCGARPKLPAHRLPTPSKTSPACYRPCRCPRVGRVRPAATAGRAASSWSRPACPPRCASPPRPTAADPCTGTPVPALADGEAEPARPAHELELPRGAPVAGPCIPPPGGTVPLPVRCLHGS